MASEYGKGMLRGRVPIGPGSEWFFGNDDRAYENLAKAGYDPSHWNYHFSTKKVDRFVNPRWGNYIEIPR
jgi:hypothetical protein